eukprot:gene19647-26333_t
MESHALSEEIIALFNKESELREQSKLVIEKRKETKLKIMTDMVARGITSMQVGSYTIVSKQKRAKKAMSKDALAEQIAKAVHSNTDSVKKAMEKAKETQAVEIKTSLRPVVGHV